MSGITYLDVTPWGKMRRRLGGPLVPSLAATTVLALTVLAADGAPPEGREDVLRIAAPGFSAVEVSDKSAAFYVEHMAQQLTFAGAQVVTQSELAALLGLNRQQQLMGCAGEARCVQELTGVLGVDALLLGSVARVEGSRFQVTLKIISARDGTVVSAYSARLDGEEALLDALTAAARQMAPEAATKLGRKLEPWRGTEERPRSASAGLRRWSWVPVAVGGLAAGFGAFAYTRAASRHDELTQTQALDRERASTLRDSGKGWQTASRVGLGLGVAGLATGATMFLLGGSSAPVAPVASAGREQIIVGITGVLP